jgi:hypothetical protein
MLSVHSNYSLESNDRTDAALYRLVPVEVVATKLAQNENDQADRYSHARNSTNIPYIFVAAALQV